MTARLRVPGPQATLDRGYARVLDPAGHPVSQAAKALEGRAVEIVPGQGTVGVNLTDARPKRTLLEALAAPMKKKKPKR